MANPSAFGLITGRLTRDVHWFNNADGSKTGKVNLAVDNNFRSRDGSTKTEYLPIDIFVPAGNEAFAKAWGPVGKGDLIQVMLTLSAPTYTNKNTGEVVYPKAVTMTVDGFPTYLEPRSVTQARRAGAVEAPVAAVVADVPVAVAPAADTEAMLLARIAELEGQVDSPFSG